MRHHIPFTKATGAGNDFVIVSGLHARLPAAKERLARALCSRHFGIGADGLLVIERSTRADFRMLYYNSDGSYGGMCGNGGRCISRYAHEHGIARHTFSFEALNDIYRAEVSATAVKLHMKDTAKPGPRFPIATATETFQARFIDTGAPHLVIFDENLADRDVVASGRALAHHTMFAPAGTNVDFIQMMEGDRLAMRTYERGVEDETLACGTGSVACAATSSLEFGLRSPVAVRTRGGEDLLVEFTYDGEKIRNIALTGPARLLFSGMVCYDDNTEAIVDEEVEIPTPVREA